jgi:NAD(P)-dependent dehydrogenase (short-subunit alcohol dehydrogenase family)
MSEPRVILITGASSGIGQASASFLADRGFTVFGTSRQPRSNTADGFLMLQLDVTSDESVNACVQAVIQRTGRMDILINNAGYGISGAIEETSIQEAKSQFETNFFGAVRMVKSVLPIMRQQRCGQIINISSMGGVVGNPFLGFYSASKFALEGYTEALRHEVKRFNIHVSLVQPTYFKTNAANAGRRTAEIIDDYSEMHQRASAVIRERIQNGMNPTLVAELIFRIIQSRSPRLRYCVGKGSLLPRMKGIIPQSMFERGTRRFWNLDS